MDTKLNQMDDALQTIFSKIDEATEKCQVVFCFGDHGMTEDGNHGGGTDEEINAALFAHFSPGCGDLGPSLGITGSEVGSDSEEAFRSINQIDLVPTISLLLGLPIPYANLGGVVPALLPPLYHRQNRTDVQLVEAPFAATALALNAAQVWNYLSTYSTTANALPDEDLSELKMLLEEATTRFQKALLQIDGFDSIAYREACGLYKYFLSRATALGKQVWTRFDIPGMSVGIVLLLLSLVLQIPLLFVAQSSRPIAINASEHMAKVHSRKNIIESTVLLVFLVFHCVLLTFSNSYIISEESIVMFMLSTLCSMAAIFGHYTGRGRNISVLQSHAAIPFIIMCCSRLNELFVTGHGQDPLIRKHWGHSGYVFLVSLSLLAAMRVVYSTKRVSLYGRAHAGMDVAAIMCLAISWVEKRSLEVTRHGYLSSRLSLSICVMGFCLTLFEMNTSPPLKLGIENTDKLRMATMHKVNILLLKVFLFTVTVTGPSAATSGVLFIIQSWGLFYLTFESGIDKVRTFVTCLRCNLMRLSLIWPYAPLPTN